MDRNTPQPDPETLDGMLNIGRWNVTQQIYYRIDLMNGMTNWQRTQAMRECKGEIGKLSTARMEHWAAAYKPGKITGL